MCDGLLEWGGGGVDAAFESSWTVDAREIAITREMSVSSGGGLRCAMRDVEQPCTSIHPTPTRACRPVGLAFAKGGGGLALERQPLGSIARGGWRQDGETEGMPGALAGMTCMLGARVWGCARAAGKVLPWEKKGTREGSRQ